MAHCALLLACTELAHLVWLAVHGDGLLACIEWSHLAWLHGDGHLTWQTFNGAHSLMQNDKGLHIGI